MRVPLRLVIPLGLLLAGLARGGEDPSPQPGPDARCTAEVLAKLASTEPRERAWGACEAGSRGVAAAIPALEALLGAAPETATPDEQHVLRCALDALIRLEACVPASLLLQHENRFSVAVLVLLARDPVANQDVLHEHLARTLAQEPSAFSLQAVACGNLLLAQRAPGFAALLLARLELTLTVQVVAADSPTFHGGSRSLGSGSGDFFARVPDGFPPYVAWALDDDAAGGGALLADGPQPIYVVRRERADSGVLPGTTRCSIDLLGTLRAWLAALLGEALETFALRSSGSLRVPWTGVDAYVQQVTAAREGLLTPWWQTARRLRAAGLLTPDEVRALTPRLTVVVVDHRPQAREALPPLPPSARPSLEGH